MAERITIDTRVKEYEIVDTSGNILGKFQFVPTDAGIVSRYQKVKEWLEEWPNMTNGRDAEEYVPEIEKALKEKIDFLVNAPVSQSFFSVTSPVTPIGDGQIFAGYIIDIIGKIIEKEVRAKNEKVKKATKKYTEKYAKGNEG